MKLKLAAEDFSDDYGIFISDDNQYLKISLDEMNLSSDLLNDLKKWYESYYRFTGMNTEELKKYALEIDKLDELGIELLKGISNSLGKSRNIKTSVYYSRGLDKVLLEIKH
jgi:hypothetical protein